jgi:CubicO group peptidase (beta-lactamase class C family)
MIVETKPTGMSAKRLERITEHLDRNYVSNGKIAGCQTLVARHGHVAYFHSLGNADAERGTPMADDTIFRIYSMTKPITSIALMGLYEQGKFQLNDPVHRFIPEWENLQVYVSGDGERMEARPATQPITFKHLLSHTGGLSYGFTDHPVDKAYGGAQVIRSGGETLQTLVQRFSDVPLMYNPGEAWMYSY